MFHDFSLCNTTNPHNTHARASDSSTHCTALLLLSSMNIPSPHYPDSKTLLRFEPLSTTPHHTTPHHQRTPPQPTITHNQRTHHPHTPRFRPTQQQNTYRAQWSCSAQTQSLLIQTPYPLLFRHTNHTARAQAHNASVGSILHTNAHRNVPAQATDKIATTTTAMANFICCVSHIRTQHHQGFAHTRKPKRYHRQTP